MRTESTWLWLNMKRIKGSSWEVKLINPSSALENHVSETPYMLQKPIQRRLQHTN